jgi:hypothetical protein
MRFRTLPAILVCLLLACVAHAQDQASPQQNGPGGYPQRGGRGYGGMGMGMAGGRGVMGTVTEAATDHFKVKTEDGQVYTVNYSVNTRIVKRPAGARGPGGPGGGGMRRGGGQGQGQGSGQGQGGGFQGTPPETIKATDIKVGDAIGAMGEVDQSAKLIGAVTIVLLDPETAKQMAEMRANYGKTWLQGKVTAIDGVKVTLMGTIDNTAYSFVADENTTFRKRRDPVTLADIAVGDTVRVEGAIKDGVFTATTVNVGGMPQGGMQGGRRDQPPPPPQ